MTAACCLTGETGTLFYNERIHLNVIHEDFCDAMKRYNKDVRQLKECSPAFSWSSSVAPPVAASPRLNSWSLPAGWRHGPMGRTHGLQGHTALSASGESWSKSEKLALSKLLSMGFNEYNVLFGINTFDSYASFIIRNMKSRNPHPFTSDKLSSSFVLSVWLGTLPRFSVTFSTACSTLLQEPVGE